MKRTINLQGRVLVYELQRKRVKNLNLRVRQGAVFVSAPERASQTVVDAFLAAHADFILRALARQAEAEAAPDYGDGTVFSLLGREYRLCLTAGGAAAARIQGEEIHLCLPSDADRNRRRRALEALLRQEGQRLLPPLLAGLLREHFPGLPEPALAVRCMKSRWGSCLPGKGRIHINLWLLTAPEDCVVYVLMHELCHFLHPDHSPAFYRALEQRLPGWRDRKKCLSAYGKYLQ